MAFKLRDLVGSCCPLAVRANLPRDAPHSAAGPKLECEKELKAESQTSPPCFGAYCTTPGDLNANLSKLRPPG